MPQWAASVPPNTATARALAKAPTAAAALVTSVPSMIS